MPVVVSSFGFNLAALQGETNFENMKKLVFESGSTPVQLTLPYGCVPSYDADTALKSKMLNAIAASISKNTAFLRGPRGKMRFRIIISNFNIDSQKYWSLFPRQTK